MKVIIVSTYCGNRHCFRTMLHVALAHVVSNVPVTVILDNTKKVSRKIDFVFSTFINSFLVDHCQCSCSR